MPVDILQPLPGGNFGDGVSLTFVDTSPGPFPETDIWEVELLSGPAHETTERIARFPFVPGPLTFGWLIPNANFDVVYSRGDSGRLTMGSSARIVVRHRNIVDLVIGQDSVDVVFDTSVGTGEQVFEVATQMGGGTGGFTAADREALTSTQQNTEDILGQWANYVSVTLPSLDALLQAIKSNTESTFRSLLGSQIVPLGSLFNVITQDQFLEASLSNGVTCEKIDVDVSFSGLAGVNLRIDQYPPDWVFRTPDSAWSFRDLAVLSFWRSGGLVGRHGIHALTHSVSPLPESIAVSLFTTVGYLQPGEYRITVDWAPGVCGELTGSIHP